MFLAKTNVNDTIKQNIKKTNVFDIFFFNLLLNSMAIVLLFVVCVSWPRGGGLGVGIIIQICKYTVREAGLSSSVSRTNFSHSLQRINNMPVRIVISGKVTWLF